MGVIPIKQDVGQELFTRDHGTVRVAELSFIDGGFHIVKCPNGAYMHANGLPVTDEDQLRAAIPNPFLEDALKWFSRRHELEENPPQPIGFHPQGYPIFADGSVPEFDDLYAYFSPGPILTAAIVALQQYKERTPGEPQQKLRAAAPPAAAAPAPVQAPELDQVAMLTARLEAAEKAAADEKALRLTAEKAVKAKKPAAPKKKAAAPKPAAQVERGPETRVAG